MKKKMILIYILMFLVALITSITFVCLKDDTLPLRNTFNVGTVKIKMYDQLGIKDFPENGVFNVHPSDNFAKQVWVVSLGSKKTYVRALVESKWLSHDGKFLPNKKSLLDTVTLHLGSDWIAGPKEENPSNGGQWYYYKYILSTDQVSTKLLDGVTFSGPAIDNTYKGATFLITIYAEGVQASYEAFLYEWKVHGTPGSKYRVPVKSVEEWAP